MTDYATTKHAQEQRELKATALAKQLYAELTPERRRELARAADVRPGSDLSWSRAAELLAARLAWDHRQAERLL